MRHDRQRVLEIILDELAQVLHLSPEAVNRCRRQAAELFRSSRPVIFLATGEEPPSTTTIESFRALTALGVEASLVRSYSFAQVWPLQVLRAQLGSVNILGDLADDEIHRLPDRFPLLCILTLSSNTVAKTVLGLRDAVPPRVLRAFLERGRPVVAAGLPPQRVALEETAGVFWGLPLAIRQWLGEGYRTLEQWGVEFVQPERLVEAVRRHLFGGPSQRGQAALPAVETHGPSARLFITTDDIRAARARGEREIRIPPHATVTDEAREVAHRWGILLLE